ncbi:MAG: segregation/condensation protein A [Pseudomonadales bacterium]|nr:segregation/condensation protein A [Pseudomonadales bacterium]
MSDQSDAQHDQSEQLEPDGQQPELDGQQPEPDEANEQAESGVHLKELREEQGDPNLLAVVSGKAYTEVPTDLYIPPDAMEVFLETFEGPLDLLIYLIRKQNLDILDIAVSKVTEQYMSYIEMMQALQLELAGEYLLMAALLAEIKSRMLLPRPIADEGDETDPRLQLIRRLQEYEQLKTAAEDLSEIPRMERDVFLARAEPPDVIKEVCDPVVDMKEILLALSRVLHRADMNNQHSVQMERLSVRERMSDVLSRIQGSEKFIPFLDLFDSAEGRMGVIVTFLAIMELMREFMVEIVQSEIFAPIYVRPAGSGMLEHTPFNNDYTQKAVEDGSPES